MNIKFFILCIALLGINTLMYGNQWKVTHEGFNGFAGIVEKHLREEKEERRYCTIKVFCKGNRYNGFIINRDGDGRTVSLDEHTAHEYYNDFRTILNKKGQ